MTRLMHEHNKKLIVFDVDGVTFKSLFILYLSRSMGFLSYLRTIFLCLRVDIGIISIERLLFETYKKFRGASLEQVWSVYWNVALIKNAQQAISEIRARGHEVVLVSSGVPNFLIYDLARRLNANYGYGIEVGIENDKLTGVAGGMLSQQGGKVKVLRVCYS